MKNRKQVTCLTIMLFLASSFLNKCLLAEDLSPDSSAEALAKSEDKAVINLTYQNGLLSADIKSASIKDIFEELKKQTGMSYEIEKEIQEQKVTISFKDKELTQAIKDILNTIGNPSYMLSYKKDKSEKYIVSGITIRKRGITETVQMAKRELQPGEMEMGQVTDDPKWNAEFKNLKKYRIRAKNVDVNELLEKLSSAIGIKIVACRIDKKIDLDDEDAFVILLDHILNKIRPKIYKTGGKSAEVDSKGNVIKEGYYEVSQLSQEEIRKKIDDAVSQNQEGEELMKQDRFLEAVSALEGASATNPDYILPLKNLAKIHLSHPEKAIKYLNEALDINRDDSELYFLFGEVYRGLYELESAKTNYTKSLELVKDDSEKEKIKKILETLDSEIVKKYAEVVKKSEELKNQQKYEDAEKEVLKLLTLEPDLKKSYDIIGNFYMDKKQYDKALAIYEMWRDKKPNDSEIFLAIADVYIHKSNKELTLEYFNKALKLAPNKGKAESIEYLIKFYTLK